MGKKKEYVVIKATSKQSEMLVESVCVKEREEEMKKRCVKSIIDFSEIDSSIMIDVDVTPAPCFPEEGVDLVIRPVKAQPKKEPNKEIDIVDLKEE